MRTARLIPIGLPVISRSGVIACAFIWQVAFGADCTPVATEVGGDIPLRLPFRAGEQYLVTQGYCKAGWSHSGHEVDFAMPEGTAVVACSSGVVVQLGTYSGRCTDVATRCGLNGLEQAGLFVKLQHTCSEPGYAWYSSYLHLSSQSVTMGQEVQAGQILGFSGNTGLSTAPHLHFHIRKGHADNPLNEPANHVPVRPTPMSGIELQTGSSGIVDFTEGFSYQAPDALDAVTDLMSPVVSYQFPDDFNSQAMTDGGILSRIVSYQWPDGFSEQALASGGILSAIASYVYSEWPGREYVSLRSSPGVSYFYQAGGGAGSMAFEGRVLDGELRPLEGAIVEVRVVELPISGVTTGPDGRYVLQSLPAGTYVLSASKAGRISDRRAVALSLATTEQDFQLMALPDLLPLTVANSTPPFVPPSDGPDGSLLRLFDGSAFISDLSRLDTAKMTIVLTHGWIPCSEPAEPTPLQDPSGWPLRFALALDSQQARTVANIVAWDWHEVARPCWFGRLTPPPEEATPAQGIALGEALQTALGTDYGQHVHFIGHSLGTLVNGYAVDYLHGYQRANHRVASKRWLPSNTHVTMSDDAAISRLIAKETLLRLVLGGRWAYASSLALGWKNPVPHESAWLDNYVCSVGRYHEKAVNVLLQTGMLLALLDNSWLEAAVKAHSYAVKDWYPRSVTSAERIAPGFGTSFEYKALHPNVEFPPTVPELEPGIAYRQSEDSPDGLTLELVMDLEAELYYPAVSVVGVAGAEAVSEWVEMWLDEAAAAGRRLGDVLLEVGEDISGSVDQAVDRVLNGVGTVWDLLNRPSLRIQLRTGPPTQGRAVHLSRAGDFATNTPAAVWLPVTLPSNVSMLAFDFELEGEGKDDALVFGVNETNLFTLATKFIPRGVTNTSRVVDVAAWAGSTNELFFGILGGTSTNCAVRVVGIRLLAFAPTMLMIASDGSGNVTLSWPSTASGSVLETATELDGSGWEVLTNEPVLFGGQFSVTTKCTDRTRFYRLRQP